MPNKQAIPEGKTGKYVNLPNDLLREIAAYRHANEYRYERDALVALIQAGLAASRGRSGKPSKLSAPE